MSKLRASLFAALLAGCRGDCEEERHQFSLQLDEAGAAFEIRGRTSDPRESVHASYVANVANLGADPCLVSFVMARSRPSEELPPRGTVQFDAVVPGARDGRVFTRSVDANEGPGFPGEEPWGIALESDEDGHTVGVSLRIVTCPDADLEVDFEILTEVCWSLGDARGSVDVTQLW